jgi:hypothetical protein
MRTLLPAALALALGACAAQPARVPYTWIHYTEQYSALHMYLRSRVTDPDLVMVPRLHLPEIR